MNTKAWRLIGAISMVWMAIDVPLMAATAVWTNTVDGSSGPWTAAGNWNNASYPGQSATGESAFLTNAVSGVYTAKVDSVVPNSISQLVIRNAGAGAAWLIVTNGSLTNSGALTCGAGGRIVVDSSGQLSSGAKAIIEDPVGASIVNGGVWSNTAATANMVIGDTLSYGQMRIRSGGKVYSGGDNTTAGRNMIGNNATALSNTVVVADSGSLWQAAGDISVGYKGLAGNSLIISNGGTVVCGGTNSVGLFSSNSFMLVSDSGSLFSNVVDTAVGWNGGTNRVVVSNGAAFYVGRNLYLGGAYSSTTPGPAANSILFSDLGTTATLVNAVYIGKYGGGGDSITISNGAKYFGMNTINIGSTAGVLDESVTVTGNGSLLTNNNGGASLFIGVYGGRARLTVSDGARVLCNHAVAMGANSSAATNNSLVVTNGSTLFGLSSTIGQMGGSNSVWVGGYNTQLSAPSLWVVGGLFLGANNGVGSNQVIIAQGGILTNSYIMIGKGTASHNALRVNGGSVISTGGGACYIGSGNSGSSTVGGTNNTITISSNGYMDMGAFGFVIGNSTNGLPGVSNAVNVTSGVLTNVCRSAYNMVIGGCPGADYNSINAGSGGALYMNAGRMNIGAWTNAAGGNSNVLSMANGAIKIDADSYIGSVSTGNTATISGTAVWNGGGSRIYVGYGAAVGNSLSVNGGILSNVSLVVGTNSVAGANNSVSVTGAGLIEANSLVAMSGNTITNVGGIYQFTTTNMTVSGSVGVSGGAVSFRNLVGADINANSGSGPLASVAFSGNNAFRLNNATNQMAAASPQTYAFRPGAAPVYAGLELVSGRTAYTNGDVTVAAGSWLTFSNTTAVMWGNVTNGGTLTVTNSSVTFKQSLVLSNGCAMTLDTNTIEVTGNLVLPTSATVTITGPLAQQDQAVLFHTTGSIIGSVGGWSVTPDNHYIAVRSNNLMLMPARKGLMFIVE